VTIRSAPRTACSALATAFDRHRAFFRHLGREAPRALGTATRDPHAAELAHARHRKQVGARLHAGAQDREVGRVRVREQLRGEPRDRGGADRGHRRRIHHRERLAALAVEQQHRALVRVLAARHVAVEHADDLDAEGSRVACAIGRHERHQAERLLRLEDHA
jgi:hypothetical protein